MNKFMDSISRFIQYILIGFLSLAYFLVMTMMVGGDISVMLADFWTYVHMVFVTFMTVLGASVGYDTALMSSLESAEFNLANELNDEITKIVNNRFDDVRNYVEEINEGELKIVRLSYLAEKQVNSEDQLTKRQLKKYKKLKAKRHILTGFNLPLFSIAKNGYKITYDASYDNTKIKRGLLIKRAASGILFSLLTVNLFFRADNVGTAFLNTIIMMSQLIVSYFTSMIRPITQLKHHIPKIVLGKLTLINGYLISIGEAPIKKKEEIKNKNA